MHYSTILSTEEFFRYLTIHISRSIGHPVPGDSTEGRAADWVPILDGVNNIDKILGIVPKREFSVVYQNAKNVVKMVVFLLLQLKQNLNTGTGCGVYLV